MNTGSYDVVGGEGGPGRFEIRLQGACRLREKLVRNGFKVRMLLSLARW
jgi:hypothetical protein